MELKKIQTKTPRTGRPKLEYPDAIQHTVSLRKSTLKLLKIGAKKSRMTIGQYIEACLQIAINNNTRQD